MIRRIIFSLVALLLAHPAWGQDHSFVYFKKKPAAGACSASYGSELNTTQTTSSPSGISESDATTGWAQTGTLAVFDSITDAPSLGTYHLSATADANGEGATYTLTGLGLAASTIYKVTIDLRHNGTGGAWKCGLGSGFSTPNATSNGWAYTSSNTTYINQSALVLYNAQEDSISCWENSGTNDGGMYADNLSVRAATLCLGSELHTSSNAASPSSEANATTGWAATNSLDSFTSESTGTPQVGTYHLYANANGTPAANSGVEIDLASAPFSLADSTKYFVRFWGKHSGTGGAWTCGFASATGGQRSFNYPYTGIGTTDTTYAEYGYEITYAAAERYFVCHENNASNDGALYIDGFSVKEITGE